MALEQEADAVSGAREALPSESGVENGVVSAVGEEGNPRRRRFDFDLLNGDQRLGDDDFLPRTPREHSRTAVRAQQLTPLGTTARTRFPPQLLSSDPHLPPPTSLLHLLWPRLLPCLLLYHVRTRPRSRRALEKLTAGSRLRSKGLPKEELAVGAAASLAGGFGLVFAFCAIGVNV